MSLCLYSGVRWIIYFSAVDVLATSVFKNSLRSQKLAVFLESSNTTEKFNKLYFQNRKFDNLMW